VDSFVEIQLKAKCPPHWDKFQMELSKTKQKKNLPYERMKLKMTSKKL
jgi:hypothetical protein